MLFSHQGLSVRRKREPPRHKAVASVLIFHTLHNAPVLPSDFPHNVSHADHARLHDPGIDAAHTKFLAHR